jgi:hypothetical protein
MTKDRVRATGEDMPVSVYHTHFLSCRVLDGIGAAIALLESTDGAKYADLMLELTLPAANELNDILDPACPRPTYPRTSPAAAPDAAGGAPNAAFAMTKCASSTASSPAYAEGYAEGHAEGYRALLVFLINEIKRIDKLRMDEKEA